MDRHVTSWYPSNEERKRKRRKLIPRSRAWSKETLRRSTNSQHERHCKLFKSIRVKIAAKRSFKNKKRLCRSLWGAYLFEALVDTLLPKPIAKFLSTMGVHGLLLCPRVSIVIVPVQVWSPSSWEPTMSILIVINLNQLLERRFPLESRSSLLHNGN